MKVYETENALFYAAKSKTLTMFKTKHRHWALYHDVAGNRLSFPIIEFDNKPELLIWVDMNGFTDKLEQNSYVRNY